MAKNYKQQGETLTLTAPAGGVVSGQGYMIGALFVVALSTAAAGATFAGMTQGVFSLAKNTHASSKAFAEGEIVYWDNANKRFDKTGTGFFPVGVAAVAAASTAAVCDVRLNGTAATAVA